MESNKNCLFGQLNISNKNTVKNVIMTFLPIFLYMVVEIIVSIVDKVIVFISQLKSDETVKAGETVSSLMNKAINQPVNLANMTLAKYIICGIIFAIMYYKLIVLQGEDTTPIKKRIKSNIVCKRTILLLICGYLSQAVTCSVLALCRPHFEKQFIEYDKLCIPITGAGMCFSTVICLIIFAPIAEELMFRGLIQGYISEYYPVKLAILLQAILFGIYHGNIIQAIYAFLFGIVLGFLAKKFKSIIPCIILHGAINASIYLVPDSFTMDTTNSIITLVISFSILVITLVVSKGKECFAL